jgi:hypothetical protein
LYVAKSIPPPLRGARAAPADRAERERRTEAFDNGAAVCVTFLEIRVCPHFLQHLRCGEDLTI